MIPRHRPAAKLPLGRKPDMWDVLTSGRLGTWLLCKQPGGAGGGGEGSGASHGDKACVIHGTTQRGRTSPTAPSHPVSSGQKGGRRSETLETLPEPWTGVCGLQSRL